MVISNKKLPKIYLWRRMLNILAWYNRCCVLFDRMLRLH